MSQLPPRASYTQISTFQSCNFKYWLKYIKGMKKQTRGQGLLRGTILHEAYDKYMFEGRTSHKIAFDYAEEIAQKEINGGTDPQAVEKVMEEANLVLTNFLPWADENDTWDLYIPEGQKQCETSGTYDIPLKDGTTKPIFFKIDALVEREGQLLMLENKFRKNLDSSGLEHDLQILLYQACWNAIHPEKRIQGVLYNIVSAKPRKKDGVIAIREFFYRGPQEEKVGLSNISSILTVMKKQEETGLWPLNPGKECNWFCEFVGPCLGIRAGATLEEYTNTPEYTVR